ncbi:MAG: hypothetical protein MNPFHGCM_02619 [Gemmatimonadaceae bacterium]|nr:hypothetical protein [Gemmatimonadaceae bacterium]
MASNLTYDDFATVTLPFDLLGRRLAMRSALGASRDQAHADSTLTVREAQFAAARTWWEVWAAQSLAAIAEDQAELYRRVASIDSTRAAEGEIAEATAFRMQLEAQRAQHQTSLAIASAAHARAALATLVGESDPARARVEDAAPELDALPNLDVALAGADRDRPDLAVARSAERAADRRRAAEVRGTLADVALTAGYKGTGGFGTSVIGLSFAPPLLNANGGARERSTGEWLVATAARRTAELRTSTEVYAALEAARALDAGTSGFDAAFVARAEVVASAAEAAYRDGAASLVELLDAFRAAADARAAFVRGTLDRALARLELRHAIGATAVEVP